MDGCLLTSETVRRDPAPGPGEQMEPGRLCEVTWGDVAGEHGCVRARVYMGMHIHTQSAVAAEADSSAWRHRAGSGGSCALSSLLAGQGAKRGWQGSMSGTCNFPTCGQLLIAPPKMLWPLLRKSLSWW